MLNSVFGPAKIFHIRDYVVPGEIDNKGGMTYAFAKDEKTNTWVYAVSKCSWRDNFCRKTGRNIALGRLNACKIQVWGEKEPSYQDVENHATFTNPMLQTVFEQVMNLNDRGSLLFNHEEI